MMLLVIKVTTRCTPARDSGDRKEINSFHIIEWEGSFLCFTLPDDLQDLMDGVSAEWVVILQYSSSIWDVDKYVLKY